MTNFNIDFFKHIHFVGIGGVSMSALAHYCLRRGKLVSGSDRVNSLALEKLSNVGAKVYIGHNKDNIVGADLVVYSSALDKANPELEASIKQGIKLVKRSEFLGAILTGYKNVIAVSGCHGKTTTTAMIGNVLALSGLNPTVFLGGEHKCYGNFRFGERQIAVVEACEYQKNFLDIYHTFSLVLNVDEDHMECYEGRQDLVNTYAKFCSNTVKAVGIDSPLSLSLHSDAITFGISEKARFRAENLVCKNGKYSFDAFEHKTLLGTIHLSVLGVHNVYNALATISVCSHFNIPFSIIKSGIEEFENVKRRFESVGYINGIEAVCDYAHHPEELRQTINAVQNTNKKTLFVFQPHTYSRTKALMNEFIEVLKDINELIIYKTYPAREKFDRLSSGKALYKKLIRINTSIRYCSGIEGLKQTIIDKTASKEYQLICFLGAGDIYDQAKRLCKSKKAGKGFKKTNKK